VYGNARKRYSIAERRLFDLPIKEVSLFASCVLGEPDVDVIRSFFERIVREADFDLINVGEIVIDGPLHRAIAGLGGGVVVTRAARKNSVRWLIRLPGSFDEYMASLR